MTWSGITFLLFLHLRKFPPVLSLSTLVLYCTVQTIWRGEWRDCACFWLKAAVVGPLESQAVTWANRTCACCSGLRLDLSVPRLSALKPAGSTGYKATARGRPECFFWADPWHTYPPPHWHKQEDTRVNTQWRSAEAAWVSVRVGTCACG